MIKSRELTDPNSCMSKARDDEMTFVLLARDVAGPATIRFWVSERIRLGKNTASDPQIVEALECAAEMECQRVTGGSRPNYQQPSPPPRAFRTREEVLAARGTVHGCCNRRADNMGCNCLFNAVNCVECGDTGWAVHPENGWNKDARRCSRGCPSRCSVCNNPNCDNPNGQH